MSENLTSDPKDPKLIWERLLTEMRLVNARTAKLEYMIDVLAKDVLQLRADQLDPSNKSLAIKSSN